MHQRVQGGPEAVFQAVLRDELTHRLGVTFEVPDRHGVGEIVGINPNLRAAFSSRRAEIVTEMNRVGSHNGNGARIAALATRRTKPAGITEQQLRQTWQAKAQLLGFNINTIPQANIELPLQATHTAIASRVTIEHATFNRDDVIRACANTALQGAPLAAILETVDGFLTSPAVIAVAEERWTTPEMLAIERQIIDIAQTPPNWTLAAQPDRVRAVLDSRPSLSVEQRQMVTELTTTGRALDVVIGHAGTGKTFSLDAVREAYETSGHRVIGVALAARTARQLQTGAGIHSSTAHALIQQIETGRWHFNPGDVLVIDEAGMIGTRLLATLTNHAHHAHQAQAKTILVGDYKQLPEIHALVKRVPYVELTENRRQQDPIERRVVLAIRQGNPHQSLQQLNQHGHLTTSYNADTLRDKMVLDWWQHRTNGSDVLMGASQRSDARDLNSRAHAILETSGHLGRLVASIDEQRFCFGDQIIALKNNYDIGVLNGDTATITGTGDNTLRIRLDDGPPRQLPMDYVTEHVAHLYARTVHQNQGLTCEIGLVLGDDTMYNEMGYTALTRATHHNHLYTVTSLIDAQPDNHELTQIAQTMETSRAKQPPSTSSTTSTSNPQEFRHRPVPDLAGSTNQRRPLMAITDSSLVTKRLTDIVTERYICYK
jgi:hypothetical protein